MRLCSVVLVGERDILKVIQVLPGVQQAQEGTTGFFVRGGNIDQNLVQLDRATTYKIDRRYIYV